MNRFPTKEVRRILTPAEMREKEMVRQKSLRAWAAQHAWGTKPATFKETHRGMR